MRKIEPYFDLSAKLGTFLAHSDMNGIESLTINYAGDLAALRIAPLTQNIVKGFLQRRLGSQVNNVNASYIAERRGIDRKSTRLNSSHVAISYAVFCLKK